MCDLADANLSCDADNKLRLSHRLEAVADTPTDESATPVSISLPVQRSDSSGGRARASKPVAAVDNFLLLAQTRRNKQRVMRATLHAIDDVFRPTDSSDPADRNEAASRKKMLKGDA